MAKPFAKSGGTDQMPYSVVSDLNLHCLPVTLLGVSRLKCVNWLGESLLDISQSHLSHCTFNTWYIVIFTCCSDHFCGTLQPLYNTVRITRFWISHGSKMDPNKV